MLATLRHYPHSELYVGTVAHGEDIHRSIEAFCDERGILMAWVQCLGALSQATLAFYTQDMHQYVEKEFLGQYEIVQGTGNISQKNGKAFAHLHMTLSGHDFTCVGGHLMPEKTKVFACEFVILALSGADALTRDVQDPQTGLALWPFCAI